MLHSYLRGTMGRFLPVEDAQRAGLVRCKRMVKSSAN